MTEANTCRPASFDVEDEALGSDPGSQERETYYGAAGSWSDDRLAVAARGRRIAWIVAGAAGAIALFEAIALVLLIPTKTVVPYTLLVDRQTGYVEKLDPLQRKEISPDTALIRSFLVQYVIAVEGFD